VGRLCASGRLAVPGSDVVTDDDGYCSRNRGRYPAQVAAPDARPALHDREEVASSDPRGARPEKTIWHEIERRSRLLLPRRNRELYGHAGVSPVERKLGLEESRLAV
jgi:hypothetical protein